MRGVIGFVLALSVIVGAAAWRSYGDAAGEMLARWGAQLGLAPSASPQKSAVGEQPSPRGVQASEVTAVAEQSAVSVAPSVVPAAAAPAAEAPTLQSMARDVATLGQKVEQLQATIEQLRASQDQMSRDVAKGLEAKATEPNLRPKTSPPAPRTAVVPARKPIAAFRQPQVTAAPAFPAPYSGQRPPEPSPPATQQLVDPEPSSAPRPPLPLHQ